MKNAYCMVLVMTSLFLGAAQPDQSERADAQSHSHIERMLQESVRRMREVAEGHTEQDSSFASCLSDTGPGQKPSLTPSEIEQLLRTGVAFKSLPMVVEALWHGVDVGFAKTLKLSDDIRLFVETFEGKREEWLASDDYRRLQTAVLESHHWASEQDMSY